MIDATLRTSAYKEGRGATAFKLRSADVPAIPLPAPAFEIYVYAPDMEGIHLRGGPIARGGIRFSDRMDYRTEVYGLMRAQMVKNAVIVPTGAKGGFYLKRRPEEAGALRDEVAVQYRRYIHALLDVTDNLLEDGSYLRLRSLTLSYILPRSFVGGYGFTNARVYVTGTNLFTATDYSGFNPDVSSQGGGAQNRGIDILARDGNSTISARSIADSRAATARCAQASSSIDGAPLPQRQRR